MQSCLLPANDFPKLFLLFLPKERLREALASFGEDFLMFRKPDTYKIHSDCAGWWMEEGKTFLLRIRH